MTIFAGEGDLFRLAVQHHMRNEFSIAFDLYSACIEKRHRHLQALHYLGILLIQCGYAQQGRSYINQATNDPESARLIENNLNTLMSPHTGRTRIERSLISTDSSPFIHRNVGTVGDWRHCRMLSFASCLGGQSSSWLTIGDQFGHDADRLLDRNRINITASALSVEYLELAKQNGRITSILEIDAESITLPDRWFDYVICKEALHHMSRPYLAIYEMLRVARKAICLVGEPADPITDWRFDGPPRHLTRTFFNDPRVGPAWSLVGQDGKTITTRYLDWWEDGPLNYVYTTSQRELEKLSRGYGLFAIATKPFNDFYEKKWDDDLAFPESSGLRNTVEQIELNDKLCEISGAPKSRLTCILFLEPPSADETELLQSDGFSVSRTRTRLLPIDWPQDVKGIT